MGTELSPIDSKLQQCILRTRLVVFDFDGVFTDNAVYVFENGNEAVRCCRSDGIGLRKLERIGIETIIISTETNPVVSARSRKLGIRCLQSCKDKRAALEKIIQEKNLSLGQVAFVGNDINDLSCLACVNLPMVVSDAHPDVIPHALYRTRERGGHGAVREICDLFESIFSTLSGG